ncbi:MAG: mannose-phosphate guanylyltransferase [Thermoproteota archaeon]|nr:mannose-phosphate guanylyltransferase [Thermoproteota archaeon]
MENISENSVKGVILAGGEGKRLRPLSYYIQKCMVPIGHMQKPLLEYIVRLLKYHGVKRLDMLVGYKNEQISNYFDSGNRFDVEISYVLDDSKLVGTGGSLLNWYRKGKEDFEGDLLVYYGDIISDINLSEMLKQHCENRAMATLALSKGYQVSVGVAEVNGVEVSGWVEKPTLGIDVGIGILALKTSALPELELLSKSNPELDIMSHLVPHLIKKGERVQAYLTDAFWYDVGSAEKYEKLDNGVIEKRLGRLVT